MNLVVRPAAAADLERAFLWYERQRAGLGNEFLDAVEHVFGAVMENPRLHRVERLRERGAGAPRVGPGPALQACFYLGAWREAEGDVDGAVALFDRAIALKDVDRYAFHSAVAARAGLRR